MEATLAPTSAETVQPAAPEARAVPEKKVDRPRQQEELGGVAANILYRKLDSVKSRQKEGNTLSDGEEKLAALGKFKDAVEHDYTDGGKKPGEALSGIALTLEGGVTLTHVKKVDEAGNFVCATLTERAGARTTGEITLSREEVALAQLRAEETSIVEAFSGDEKEVVKLYIESVKRDGEELPDPESTEGKKVNETIKRAAHEAGILTVEDIKGFVDTFVPQQQAAEGTTLTPQQEQQNAVRDTILRAIDGKNISDPDTLKAVFEQGRQIIPGEIATSKARLAELQQKTTRTPEEDAELQQIQVSLPLLERAVVAVSDTTAAENYFAEVYVGKKDAAHAKLFAEAIKTNNTDTIVKLIQADLAEKASDDEKTKAEKRTKRQQIDQYLKTGGMAGGLALFLLVFAALEIPNLAKQ